MAPPYQRPGRGRLTRPPVPVGHYDSCTTHFGTFRLQTREGRRVESLASAGIEGGRVHMEAAVDVAPEAGARGAVVLVVDDEPAIRRLVVRALQKDGVVVVEAPDGRVALDAFTADPDRFAALFCDISLPDVPGEEVVRSVRAIRPSLPVVVMTGFDPIDMADEIGPVGPLEWLLKPFTLAAIGEMARRVVVAP